MELAKIEVECIGPIATHNMPCAVCREKHAVIDLSCGIMKPCWSCRKEGYRLLKVEDGSVFSWIVNFIYGDKQ